MPRVALLVILYLLVGCASPKPPHVPTQPPADANEVQPSVPPATTVAVYLGGCGWLSGGGKPERMVMDLVLIQQRDYFGISAETRSALTSAGGVIVFAFSTNIVRVELDTVNLPEVVGGKESSLALTATTVTNFENFEAMLLVEFERPIVESDLRAVAALGVEAYPDPNGTSLMAYAQNRVLPQLRGLEGIKRIEARQMVCAYPDV